MLRMLRAVLLIVITVVALSLVVAIARPETGTTEKATLAVGVVALFIAAVPVRRLGSPTSRALRSSE